MNTARLLKINHFDPYSRQLVLPHAPLLSSKNLALKGINFDYYQHKAGESPTHTTEHHVLCLMLDKVKPERKLNNTYQHKSLNIGSVAIIPAKAEHWTAWKTQAKFALFSIHPQTLANIAPETVNPDKIELLPTFAKPEPDPLIASIGMAVKQQLESNPNGDSFYLEHLFSALCAHLIKNYCSIAPQFKEFTGGLPPYKLKQAIEYINDNLDRQIKLKDVAKLINISQYYFCRLFHDSMGVSPYQYVIQQRVAKAKDLISNSKLPLVDISYECGFSSQSQMTQHFRKVVGVTPKVYRNKL